MRDVILAYQNACSTVVMRNHGFVAKFMGDGVMVYFGYPRAEEDDAERAVRAGLEIAATVAKLETRADAQLLARIGISTGLVVVGDLIGDGSSREQAVVGDTPNLAARLQAQAEPGAVLVSESTRRLIGASFELKALGPQALKGFGAPISAWSVLREATNVSRFEASRSTTLTPFVGRETEVGLLLAKWRDAARGEGQLAMLSGEAGIGKSRMLTALRDGVGEEPHVALRYQCSPHHVNDAFYPIVGQIWHAAGFTSDEPAASRLDKLEAMIGISGLSSTDVAPVLAALLSIPAEGRYRPLEMAPADLKERTVEVLIDMFAGLTRDSPVLALLEDAHWIDPTSLEVFNRLVERLPALRALLLVTFRPEFEAPWIAGASVTALPLNRFGRPEAIGMIERVTGGKALPEEVLEQILVKTDGVPLFVEELTKTVLETDLLREQDGAYVLTRALTPLAIPSTLQDSLMARLDRLAPVREIAQIGAAIGREFSHALLEAVSPVKGYALTEALNQLMASEMIYGRGVPPEATYTFKHALVQDTAYSSLLRSRRQPIHADIARALTQRFADQVESAPAVIAQHYAQAGMDKAAAQYWLKAAELASSRSALTEAARYTDAGLALTTRLTPAEPPLELALQVARANTYLPMKGYNAPETVAALTEAKRLLDAGVGDDLQSFTVLHGLCAANYIGGHMKPALALAHQIVEVADRQSDPTYKLVSYRVLGTVQYLTGQFRAALKSLEQAEMYRDSERDKRLSFRFGLDPGLDALSWQLMPLFQLGYLDRWAAVVDQVRKETSEHWHPPTIATCNSFASVIANVFEGNLEAAENNGAEMVAYCGEKKIPFFAVIATLQHAVIRAMRNPTLENIDAFRQAIGVQRYIGMRLTHSPFIHGIASALLATGNVIAAESMLREGFAEIEETGELQSASSFHHLEGRIALRQMPADLKRAEFCFKRAIEIARGQEGQLLEMRAACDLVRLWRETDSREDCHALLAPILDRIYGGETIVEVRNARVLLAQLR